MTQTPEQIRAAAMALMAQAEAMENTAAEPPSREDYVDWAIGAVGLIETPEQAWHHLVDTWDELDGDETLMLMNALIEKVGDPAPDDADYVEDEVQFDENIAGEPDPTAMRAFLLTQGINPAVLSAMDTDELRAAVEDVTAEPKQAVGPTNPWPLGTPAHDRFAARLQASQPQQRPVEVAQLPEVTEPAENGRAPRGMKRRTTSSPPRLPAGGEFADGHALTRGDDPELAAARAQARTQSAPVGKLKSGAPRKASGHQIPPGLEQWKRDGAGRRVPIDQEA